MQNMAKYRDSGEAECMSPDCGKTLRWHEESADSFGLMRTFHHNGIRDDLDVSTDLTIAQVSERFHTRETERDAAEA